MLGGFFCLALARILAERLCFQPAKQRRQEQISGGREKLLQRFDFAGGFRENGGVVNGMLNDILILC